MSNEIFWNLELELQPGQEDAFANLMTEMINATNDNEPGTLNYEWSTSADGAVCHIYERYADSDALMQHLAAFGEHFAERFLEVFRPTRFTVYGSPSAGVREALAAFNPVYMDMAGGFSR